MDHAVYMFESSKAAWAFFHACDAAGIMAGFPGLKVHTVEVGIRTWMERESADKLAGSNPTTYVFANEVSSWRASQV